MSKWPQCLHDSPNHQRQQCQLTLVCLDRGVTLSYPHHWGPTPPSPLKQDDPLQHKPACLMPHLSAPLASIRPSTGSITVPQPGLRTGDTTPPQCTAWRPCAWLEKLTVDKHTGATISMQKPFHMAPQAEHTAETRCQGSVQPWDCMSCLGGLCGGSSSSSHPPSRP